MSLYLSVISDLKRFVVLNFYFYQAMSEFFFENESIIDSSESEQQQPQDQSVKVEGSEFSSVQGRSAYKNKGLGAQQKGSLIKEQNSARSLDKKERNKMSAKMSRDRKKLYIEILQERQKALSKQLQNRKKELQETKGYLQRVVNQNKTMSGFTASRHDMMKKIKNLLQRVKNGEDTSPEINNIIDSLRYRIGATGKERINTINEYFRQIVNLSLPALHRYMMWSAAQGKHLFGTDDQEQDEWFSQLRNALNLSEQQKKEIQSKKLFLREQKILLEKLIRDLKHIKNEIEQKSIQLQDMIDGIREILTPLQAAHFILFIEKNKYRKELNLCQSTLDEEQPSLRKLVKREDE